MKIGLRRMPGLIIASLITCSQGAFGVKYHVCPKLGADSIEIMESRGLAEESVAKVLAIYENSPSWQFFLNKSNVKSDVEYSKKWLRLVENAKKINLYDNETISKAIQIYCKKHSRNGDLSLFLLDERNSIFLLNRIMFDAPYSEPKGSDWFSSLTLNADESVRRLWPIENDKGNLRLADVMLVLTGNHDYDAHQEFLYYAKSFKRRIFE